MFNIENTRIDLKGRIYRSMRMLERKEGSLYLYWFLRMAVLIALVLYFLYRQDDFETSELSQIRFALFVFFTYNVVSGFLGILHPEWFMRAWVKMFQFGFEIVLYSLFYLLTRDSRADIGFFYFIPIFFAVHFLTFPRALAVIVFGAANLYFVVFRLTQLGLGETAELHREVSLASIFWPRLILILALSFVYALRRRISLPLELQDEGTAVMDLFRSLENGVFILDKHQQIVFVNKALQERHGPYRPGQRGDEYFRCQERTLEMERTENPSPLDKQQPKTRLGMFVDQDGNAYQVEIELIVLQDEHNRYEGVFGIVKDSDRPKQFEVNLKNQLHLYGEKVKSLLFERELWQETYAEMGKRLAGFEHPRELMNFVVEETCKRLNAETCSLFLLDKQVIYRKAIAGVEPDWLKDECYQVGQGMTGQVIQADLDSKYGRAVRHNRVENDPKVVSNYLEAYKARLKTHRVAHLLAVPLNDQDRSFGVLRVVNKLDGKGSLHKDGFGPVDQDFLITIASMVAIALENNRLYSHEQERRKLSDMMLEVSRKINTNLNLHKILPEILDELDNVVPYSSISIQVIEGDSLRIIACRGFENRNKVMRLKFPLKDSKFPNPKVIKTKSPLRLDDVTQDYPHFLEEADKYYSSHIRSWMGVPLISRDRVIGMISLDHRRQGFYTSEMESVALTFANQVAIALANARLFREQTMQMRSLDRLFQVSQAVASSIKLDDVLHRIASMANQVSSSDHSGVVLFDEDGIAHRSYETHTIGQPLHERTRPEGVTREVIDLQKPVFFNQLKTNDRRHNPVVLQSGFRSYGGLPIVASEKVLGVLFVHSYKPNRYDRRKIIPLLETLCNQAAVAIENALLYEKVAEQTRKLKDLVIASRGLIQHTSLMELVKYCAENAAEIFNVEDCSLYLHNKERKTVDLVYSTVIPPEVWDRRESFLDGSGLTSYVARTGEILNFGGDEYKEHPAWSGHDTQPFLDHLQHLPSKKCHSLLIGPLKDSQGQNVGVLKLENRKDVGKNRRFDEFEVDMHQTFASHIGTAVERARLYEQLDKDARKAARRALSHDLHDISNLIHGALIMRLEIAKEKLARDMFMDVGQELTNISKAAQTVHSLLRWIHYGLRGDDVLQEKGLIPSLEHIAELLKLPLETHVLGRELLTIEIEYALYKIGLEALVNAAKHGGDHTQATIRLVKDKTKFTFEVVDNGFGFDKAVVTQRPHTFGLVSMRRWAESIEADFDFQSQLRSGTTISVSGKLHEKGEAK